MTHTYLLGPSDPNLRHSSSDIALSLKAALLVKPRVSLVPAMLLDNEGMQDLLFTAPKKPEEIGWDQIRLLAFTRDKLSQGRPVLTLSATGRASSGIEFFKEWSGLGGRLRTDPVKSVILSDVIDTSQPAETYLRRFPRFQLGVNAIDDIFIEGNAIDLIKRSYHEPFRLALQVNLEDLAEAGAAWIRPLACHLLEKLDEPESLSRSFVIRECQNFLGFDISNPQSSQEKYLVFREEIVDLNWRISHAFSIGANLWEGFRRRTSFLKKLISQWYRISPSVETIKIPYEGKYLSEISLKQILELRGDNGYLNQLNAIEASLARSKSGKLDVSAFEGFLHQLAEKFPSAKGDSRRKKIIKLTYIPAIIGCATEEVVPLISPLLAQLDPSVIIMGDLAALVGAGGSAAIVGLARRVSDEPMLTRQFKAFGIGLVTTKGTTFPKQHQVDPA